MMKKTRTDVRTRLSQRRQRRLSGEAAYRALASVMLGAQLLLWLTFFSFDRAFQATWQSAVMLLAPLAAICAVWALGAPALETPAGKWIGLMLVPCLMLDAALLLFGLSGLIGLLMPQYPPWVSTLVPAAVCVLSALCARPRGAAYGAITLRGLLLILFVLGTLFLRASSRTDRLWPLLGKGIGNTAYTALLASGSVWGAALLFALPEGANERGTGKRAVLPALLPWALGCVWALWFGMLRPWSEGDVISVAQKLTGLSRNASSVVIYELAGLMWMLLLPLSLTGALSACETLVARAIPKCPRWIPLVAAPLPGVCLLLFNSDSASHMLATALPWRAAAALAAGAALWILAWRERT